MRHNPAEPLYEEEKQLSNANNKTRCRTAGAVYAMTNSAVSNAVAAFRRENGTLVFIGTFPTGGRGIGSSLCLNWQPRFDHHLRYRPRRSSDPHQSEKRHRPARSRFPGLGGALTTELTAYHDIKQPALSRAVLCCFNTV